MTTRDSWPKVMVMVVCLVVLAIDVSSIPRLSALVLRPMYVAGAVGLVAWRARWYRPGLVMFGSTLCVASAARALVLTFEWDRWAGVALNLLLAVFAFGFVRNRPEVEDGVG